jgi:nitrogen fixation protein
VWRLETLKIKVEAGDAEDLGGGSRRLRFGWRLETLKISVEAGDAED